MPIYEYKCDACGHVLDALQKVDEEPLKFCPSCSKEALRKLISAPAFRLKGTGWYETDFKKDNKRNLADGSTSAPKAATETKADTPAGGTAAKGDGSAASKGATKSAE
jgi:putative FmdB family regulatory protein